jgi:hypothetical protein
MHGFMLALHAVSCVLLTALCTPACLLLLLLQDQDVLQGWAWISKSNLLESSLDALATGDVSVDASVNVPAVLG